MKIKLFFSTAVLGFMLAAHANAESQNFKTEIAQKAMNQLEEEGLFSNLSQHEIAFVGKTIESYIENRIGTTETNLTEGNAQFGFFDDIVSFGKKAVSAVGSGVKAVGSAVVKGVSAAVRVLGPLAQKAINFAMAHKGELLALAKTLSPVVAGVGLKLAEELNLDPKLVQGAQALLQKQGIQAVDRNAIINKVKEIASTGRLQ